MSIFYGCGCDFGCGSGCDYRADEKSLESYGISAGDIVHMVIQLRGGGQI